MILNRITFLLEQVYRHLAYQSECMEQFGEKLNAVANAVAEPTGSVSFGGAAKVNIDEATKAFDGIAHGEIEAAHLSFRFDRHLYLSVDPKMNKKVKKALDEAPLNYLIDSFKAYEKLTRMMESVEGQVREFSSKVHEVNGELDANVDAMVAKKYEDQQSKLDRTFAEVREDRKRIEAALDRLEARTKEAQAVHSEAKNFIKANRKHRGGFQMIEG